MVVPPLFDRAPALTCSRWLGDAPCGRPGVIHVLWTDDGENGICCLDHAAEVGTIWRALGVHAYNPVCSIAGAHWGADRCHVPDGGLPLVGHAEAAA